MRGWQATTHGEPGDVLTLESELPSPTIRPSEVRIAVEAANVNFADILVCRGTYQERPDLPFVPGIEACGIVVESATSGIAVGDRVVGMCRPGAGGFAEEAVLRGAGVLKVPDGMPAEHATILYTTYQTSHVALFHRARLVEGEWLLVHAAAGGVGSSAVQLGAAVGAKVIATAGGADKVELALALGADHAFDSALVESGELELRAAVREVTDGHGIDVAYDPVGGELGDLARRLMAWEGRLLPIGFAAGGPVDYPGNHMLVKNYSVLGVYWGSYLHPGRRHIVEEAHEELLRWYGEGRIVPPWVETVPLADVIDGLDRLAARKVIGRLVVTP